MIGVACSSSFHPKRVWRCAGTSRKSEALQRSDNLDGAPERDWARYPACPDRSAHQQNWPLREQSTQFELGHILNCAVTDALPPQEVGGLATHHAGLWECDLATNSLIWSGGVYDIFGLERGSVVTRDMALSLYAEDSRVKLERLRSFAVRYKCGFTLDARIRPTSVNEERRMRVIAAPVCEGDAVVRLHGIKLII
nr:hypothetical protein [Sphingomonas sp.]